MIIQLYHAFSTVHRSMGKNDVASIVGMYHLPWAESKGCCARSSSPNGSARYVPILHYLSVYGGQKSSPSAGAGRRKFPRYVLQRSGTIVNPYGDIPRTQRKPTVVEIPQGWIDWRSVERTPVSSRFHAPPRTIPNSPRAGPVGLLAGDSL